MESFKTDEQVLLKIFGEIGEDPELKELADFLQTSVIFRRSDLKNKVILDDLVEKYKFEEAVIFGHVRSNVHEFAGQLSLISSAKFDGYYTLLNSILSPEDQQRTLSADVSRKEKAELTMGEPFSYMTSRASKDFKPAIIFSLPNQISFGTNKERITYYELILLMKLVKAIGKPPFPIIFLYDDETQLIETRTQSQIFDDYERSKLGGQSASEAKRQMSERRREFLKQFKKTE